MRKPPARGVRGARVGLDKSRGGDAVQFTRAPLSNQPRPLGPRARRRRRRARFARSMVFEEFRYKHARAIDYDGFIDRKPNQRPRLWRASP